jgi:predicted MPP superfamily phosphohydrolase
VLYALINAATLRVTLVTVALPHLPSAWRGRTAALVTDLHFGHVHSVGFARRVVARLAALAPDVVFIAGDLFDGGAIDRAAVVAPWRDLAVPRGIYFVTGNHDEFSHPAPVLAAVRDAGIRVLDNAHVDLDGLQVIGVHDGVGSDPVALRDILARVQVNPAQPSILLNHQPANLPIAEAAGISLQLSGHTHSGQFWPWNLLVRRIYGPFAYGLHRLRGLQVLTSSGAGTWGPPLRLGTRSELVLITFA